MKYVGIDLGTTNTVICSYDGQNVRIHANPENGSPTTPSAIYIGKQGRKLFGCKAYDMAAKEPQSAATKFKRLMGTSTPIRIGENAVLTPEECSAQILSLCFGYLPEEMRKSDAVGVVITVPAAFDQMQKAATLEAAQMAGLGEVALIQEPVAAIMSVMREKPEDGMFLVFDMGGGTLDVAIAESINGSINLLSHGGIAMCGGVDFDRLIYQQLVLPRLRANFDIPEAWDAVSMQKLERMGMYAGERAKIHLSSAESASILLDAEDLNLKDAAGQEIDLEIPLTRADLNAIIKSKVSEASQAARSAMGKAGVGSRDIGRIVFVGGPTQYAPLRDMVASELGVAASTEVDPMAAVAIGAAVFAESIDWTTRNRSRKSGRGSIQTAGTLGISFDFVARTPTREGRVAVRLPNAAPAYELQFQGVESGWVSGRLPLEDGKVVSLPLSKMGDNPFKVEVFDPRGVKLALPMDCIVMVRTAASVDGIPASTSVAIESREQSGGRMGLSFLVKEGDILPKKGRRVFKAETKVKAGSSDAINFRLWAGEIDDPISDNQFIGVFSIRGSDFDFGAINPGDELICQYEMDDSGVIMLEVSVPSIGNSFASDRNFYSPTTARIDYSHAASATHEEASAVLERVCDLSDEIDDPRLERAREKLESAQSLTVSGQGAEEAKMAAADVQQAKKLIYLTRKDNKKKFQQAELDRAARSYRENLRATATAEERSTCDTLIKSVQSAIDHHLNVEDVMGELRAALFRLVWRDDVLFRPIAASIIMQASEYPHLHQQVAPATALFQRGMWSQVRDIVGELMSELPGGAEAGMDLAAANIAQG